MTDCRNMVSATDDRICGLTFSTSLSPLDLPALSASKHEKVSISLSA